MNVTTGGAATGMPGLPEVWQWEEQLVGFGTRYTGSSGHVAYVDWLAGQFSAIPGFSMRTDRLTDEQRRHEFLGAPYWIGRGFGLNLSVVTDPAKSAPLFGPGGLGTFSWPGAYGTWWQADPAADLILLYLIQNCPDLTVDAATAVAGNTSLAKLRTAQPKFVRRTYSALGL